MQTEPPHATKAKERKKKKGKKQKERKIKRKKKTTAEEHQLSRIIKGNT